MKLEDEIKQKVAFADEYHKALVNILYTAAWLNGFMLRALKPYGISPEQYNVLRILRGQHQQPASITLIQDRMLDKNSNASRLVEKLRQKDLVTRKACENDRRQVDVVITPQGLDLLEQAEPAIRDMQTLLKNISHNDAGRLNDILDLIRDGHTDL